MNYMRCIDDTMDTVKRTETPPSHTNRALGSIVAALDLDVVACSVLMLESTPHSGTPAGLVTRTLS
jgi:hypothetical protein